jgi:ABC-type nickel/cobalt efflux system permease component RcnA
MSGVLLRIASRLTPTQLLHYNICMRRQDGRALAFVIGLVPCPLTTFIMTYALVRGMLVLGLVVTAVMAARMVATIGGLP